MPNLRQERYADRDASHNQQKPNQEGHQTVVPKKSMVVLSPLEPGFGCGEGGDAILRISSFIKNQNKATQCNNKTGY
jgi:hypothetical protein